MCFLACHQNNLQADKEPRLALVKLSFSHRYMMSRSAFTLIELLAVFAVVAILTAILIPTLSKVRESAHQTEGIAQMRNIGSAILLYTNSNGGVLPGPLYASHPGFYRDNQYFLGDKLAEFLDASGLNEGDEILTLTNQKYVSLMGADPALGQYLVYHRIQDPDGTWRVDPWGYPGHSQFDRPMPILSITDPSNQVMLKDLDQMTDGPRGYPRGSSYPNAPSEPIYGTKRNVLFFDGRVETESANTTIE